jgi:CCR4-NOT transcription complex subunit 1
MELLQELATELDGEGRYHFFNSIANQLRYPNSHTHYFSCVLLYLFAEVGDEVIKEQITRVLLERLIVHRPHPWGLLITFMELIKNPRYNFWQHKFTHCADDIKQLFESVARSCMPGTGGTPQQGNGAVQPPGGGGGPPPPQVQ